MTHSPWKMKDNSESKAVGTSWLATPISWVVSIPATNNPTPRLDLEDTLTPPHCLDSTTGMNQHDTMVVLPPR